MSSIVLKQDHGGHKAGAVISVPYVDGKKLIADGIGEYLEGPKPGEPKPGKAPTSPHASPAKPKGKGKKTEPEPEPAPPEGADTLLVNA